MGYLANLITSLASQINAATNSGDRLAMMRQLATAQRAAGSSGVQITVGYLADLKASLQAQIDTVTTDGERGELINQLASIQNATAASSGGSSTPTAAYTVSQALAPGDNLITHGLNLVSPFTTTVIVKDNASGSQILPRIKNETANSLVISMITPVASVSIKIT
jgi:hypothetical protein